MKRIIGLIFGLTLFFSACKEDPGDVYKTVSVTVQLELPNGAKDAVEGVAVKLSSTAASFDVVTDATGKSVFAVPVGIYEVTATQTRSNGGVSNIYNWTESKVAVTDQWGTASYTGGYSGGVSGTIKLTATASQTSQIVIKEVFAGGTLKDDGSGTFAFDKYVVLYNNSATTANLGNMCLAMVAPFNAQATNPFYGTDGKLIYEAESWVPAVQAYWYFQKNVVLEPGKQVVIALNNAVNNTLTYSKSINFDNSSYYCTYDIEKFPNTSYYVTPAASIPTSNYLKTEKYATANAWATSTTSPGIFIFDTKGTTPAAFAADASTTYSTSAAYISKKVPVSWVVDGVEGYLLNNTSNQKRFTSSIDAGFVNHLNNQGYSLYRNVDKAATEALTSNAGKLVYGYSLGTVNIGGTTDPSGINAEASTKNGARIIYMDTNNSTNDFHLRSQAALRGN
jgi:hypothetical protein